MEVDARNEPDTGHSTLEANAARLVRGVQVPVLDGIRGVAVLMVVLYHVNRVTPRGDSAASWVFRHVCRNGWGGVELFFVLSGFLITGGLADGMGSKHYFGTFYARRTLRIFPLYYAALLLFLVVLPELSGSFEHVAVQRQLWLWGYGLNVAVALTHGWDTVPRYFDHFWSLAVEEQFYLVWPAVLFVLRRHARRVCMVMIVLGLGLRTALLLASQSSAAFALMPSRIDLFAVGGLLALWLRAPERNAELLVQRARRTLAVAALGIAAIGCSVERFDARSPTVLSLGVSLLGLCYGSLLLLALAAPACSWLCRSLSGSLLGSVGRYSYAIYLLHYPIVEVAGRRAVPQYLQARLHSDFLTQISCAIAAVLLSYALAFVSYHAFEKHWLRLKRHFVY
jgi:peptidoglycan/LPS O-acetylase OafA/YrhL